ncbi:MAG: WG repeat-containing protein [Prevotellaceae bacterium]|jgi:hypothetical protein|nr:WG repeat-containing protein [Prevotellaceae bacterium]
MAQFQFDKYGRWINPEYQSQLIPPFVPRVRRHNVWERANDFICDIGDWLDDNRSALANNLSLYFYFGVWIVLAIGVIVQLFSSGFGSALLTAIIGGVIVYYAAAIGMFILMHALNAFFYVARYIFYNIYTLLIVILLGIGIYFSNQANVPKDRVTAISSSPTLQSSKKNDHAGFFYEELTAVKLNGKWGYTNKDKKEVIPCKYDNASKFNQDLQGLALVKLKGICYYINTKGNRWKYDEAYGFIEGLAPVMLNGKWDI